MKVKLLPLVLALIMCAMLFAGCGQTTADDDVGASSVSQSSAQESTQPQASASPSSPAPSSAAASSPAASSAPVSETSPAAAPVPTEKTITDMAGRTVTIPAEIKSVGTFGAIGVLNTVVLTMGAGPLIINEGSASFVNSPSWAKYVYKFAPQIQNMPQFENADREIIIEEVLAAAPDLCLSMSRANTEFLEQHGLTVVQIAWQQDEDVHVAIRLLGEVFDAQERAEDYLAYFDEMIAKANALTANVADRKTAVYGAVSRFSQPHAIAEWWIAQAGGISVTTEMIEGQESLSYTLEDLLLWNPDIMFTSSNGEVNDILADERLSDIPAVRNNDIYSVPRISHTWGNRTPEQPLTILWAMNKMYPELYSNDELKEDIRYFYSHFFNYNFSDADLDEIVGG